MSGTNAVVDSDVIIFASKRLIDIEKLLSTYERLYVSIVSYMEVYAFDFAIADEQVLIDEMFNDLEIIDVGRAVSDHAIVYRKSKTKKIKLPDAVILATAKHLGAHLLTNNVSDFVGIDASVHVEGVDHLKI